MYYLVGMARGLLLPLSSSSVCSSLTCVGSVPFSANTSTWLTRVSPSYMKFTQPRFRRLPTQTCPCGWRGRSCGRPPPFRLRPRIAASRRRICIDILANLVKCEIWVLSRPYVIMPILIIVFICINSLRCHLLFHFHSLQTFSACADDQCEN